MKNKTSIKMYNLVFPIWLLWLFPLTWIVVLPANFIIDSLVVLITLKLLKARNIKNLYKKTILKVWVFGFLSDFIGTAIMLIPELIYGKIPIAYREWWYKNLSSAVSYDPFKSGYAVAWIVMSMIITSFFIYLFNYKVSFKKLDIEEKSKKKLALSLAIVTSPYLFLLPTMWFY